MKSQFEHFGDVMSSLITEYSFSKEGKSIPLGQREMFVVGALRRIAVGEIKLKSIRGFAEECLSLWEIEINKTK